MEASSFASRRPAATSLPAFSLPPPDIPSMRYPASSTPAAPLRGSAAPDNSHLALSPPSSAPASQSQAPPVLPAVSSVLTPPSGASADGLSPFSSIVNTTSSQSSQPGPTPGAYYTQSPVSNWPTTSSYSYTNGPAHHPGASQGHQSSYASSSRSIYSTASPSPHHHFTTSGRSAQPPGTTEGLPATTYSESPSILNPSPGSSGLHPSSHHQRNPSTSQASLSTHATSTSGPLSNESSYRPPTSVSSYYSPSTTSQQQQPSYAAYVTCTAPGPQSSLSAPSPATSGGTARPSSISGTPRSLSGMAPPMGYGAGSGGRHPPPTYPGYTLQPSPMITNLQHPGSALSMIGGPNGMTMPPGYGHPPHPQNLSAYSHGQQLIQQAERPFKCDRCPQSFNRNHDLKRHKRIHLAVKPFPCTFCEKSFSRKDALKVCLEFARTKGKSSQDSANTRMNKTETPACQGLWQQRIGE